MTPPKGTKAPSSLSDQTHTLLLAAISLHAQAAACCTGQARELFEKRRPGQRDLLTGVQRAVHELEAATHSAALTGIGCTIANLEAAGLEVWELRAAYFGALALQANVAPSDPEPH